MTSTSQSVTCLFTTANATADDLLVENLYALAAWLDFQLRQALDGERISIPDFDVLDTLVFRTGGEPDAYPASTLRLCFSTETSRFSHRLAKLESRQLIERLAGYKDRRRRRVKLTAKGLNLVQRVRQRLTRETGVLKGRLPVRLRNGFEKSLQYLRPSIQGGSRAPLTFSYGPAAYPDLEAASPRGNPGR